jgi:L-2-hydroxyglutarate oxidase LhgO
MTAGVSDVDQVDAVVIGAGVVGLAVARALTRSSRLDVQELLVLESQEAIGMGTSSRNSEVIHAGIYYAAGSLKAICCVQGRQQLYAYAQERGIPHRRCGKLIVATEPSQISQLESIVRKAQANGVDDLRIITREEAQLLEPALRCEAAILSPSTGIIDSHAYMLSLQGDLEQGGGMVVCHSRVASARCEADGTVLCMADGSELKARIVVNSAGVYAPGLAALFEGMPAQHVPTAYYAKGNYFTLSGKAPFSHLIYPVPEAAGLGVHLTLDLGGQAKFGPDVEWVDDPEQLAVDPDRCRDFYAEVRRYWPALADDSLQPGYAGIRPKLGGEDQPACDFVLSGPAVHGVPGLMHLFGIESPGLTSSLALADRVVAQLESCLS